MSELQPEKTKFKKITRERSTYRVITSSQVEDIFKGGVARDAGFMKTTLNNIFKSKGHPNRLTEKYQYISQNSIEGERKNIFNYIKSLVQMAESGEVNWETMLKANKRNMSRNGLYMGVAMGISALFLSTIIPKVQYLITKIRTGQDKFPGTVDLSK